MGWAGLWVNILGEGDPTIKKPKICLIFSSFFGGGQRARAPWAPSWVHPEREGQRENRDLYRQIERERMAENLCLDLREEEHNTHRIKLIHFPYKSFFLVCKTMCCVVLFFIIYFYLIDITCKYNKLLLINLTKNI